MIDTMDQIQLHNQIDLLIKSGPTDGSLETINRLFNVNEDVKQYFYSVVDDRWLSWLWANDFLKPLKEKAQDPHRYGYTTPELSYLVRIAPKAPKDVVDIILGISISATTFNPEVIDRFSWICGELPADQLARVVPKIHYEKWIPLMRSFNSWGFEYGKMLKCLADANNYDGILLLAESILSIRTQQEINETFNGLITDNPFYFDDLDYTEVFQHLVSVDDAHAERGLEVSLSVLSKVVTTGKKSDDDHVFSVAETFHLFDVDFFELRLGEKQHMSYRDDVRSLAAVVKELSVRVLNLQKGDDQITRVYKKYFSSLPDGRSLWRLRLFVLSQKPESFKAELRGAFFRIFDTDDYHELISGTEYHKALQAGFATLSKEDQRSYVERVISYFSNRSDDEKVQHWNNVYGLRILSSIDAFLTEAEKDSCNKVFGGRPNPDYEPEPTIRGSRVGTIKPRGPITMEEFGKLDIVDIAEKLRTAWAPDRLRGQNTAEDFHNPLNAEGAGELVKYDIPKRFQDYITNAALFFSRDSLDQHYTYSFLRGVEETLREHKVAVEDISWDGLFNLFVAIIESGKSEPFDTDRRERDIMGGWLASWSGVLSAMADVLLKGTESGGGNSVFNVATYRSQIVSILSVLLAFPDPTPADEVVETAKIKTKQPGSEDYQLGDPFTTAINTVRGRAFQVLVQFIFQDGKKYPADATIKIEDDVKRLYVTTLEKEETQAIMFEFGHYLPSFYFRDKEWIRGLLPEIFPIATDKKDLYLAAWEGYLANSLYEEIFNDPQFITLYQRAISFSSSEYTKRRYNADLDDGLATHIALAFMYYDNFGFDSDLYKAFWSTANTKRHSGFISFLGRSFVSGDNKRSDELLKENPTSRKKLLEFWDWALEQDIVSDALKEFGYWMNTEKGVLDLVWQAEHTVKTLQKTSGAVDWDFGITKSIVAFAKGAPKETLEILSLHLLTGGVREKKTRIPYSLDNEWLEAFKILMANNDTRDGAYTLINDLIREGGNIFWVLKDALQRPQS